MSDGPDAPHPAARAPAWADVPLAVEVFAHPCRAERAGPLWVMRDAPRRRGAYRAEEGIALGAAPDEVHRIAPAPTRGRFAVCAIRPASVPEPPCGRGSGPSGSGCRRRGR